jgi:hypothetical protein
MSKKDVLESILNAQKRVSSLPSSNIQMVRREAHSKAKVDLADTALPAKVQKKL